MTGPRPTATSSISAVTLFASPAAVRNATSTPFDGLERALGLGAGVDRHVLAEQLLRLGRDLLVLERQHARQQLDHGHVGAEAREDRRELDADGAGADDDQAACGTCLSSQDLVRGHDRLAVGRQSRAAMRGREPVARMTFFVSMLRLAGLALDDDRLRAPSRRPWPLKSVILFFLKR